MDILNSYFINVLVVAGIYVILSLGLNLTIGFAGQVSLGHAAFYAIGAYTAAILSSKFGYSIWMTLPIAAVVTWVIGALLGLPSLRVKEDFLAVVTMGLGLIIQSLVLNLKITGGPMGIGNIKPVSLFNHSLGMFGFFVFEVALIVILIFVMKRMVNSRFGRALIAIREDETVADTLGINTTKYKVLAFAIGAMYAGIAGTLFAHYFTYVSPDSFGFMESATILSMVVIGGLGSIKGSVIGAVILSMAPELLRGLKDYRILIYGLLMVMMMRYRPQGLFGDNSLFKLKRKKVSSNVSKEM
ncbi:branched-chain amino acid ABC transporter permease [Clostridium sp. A1-XYC3]|uniref:Branched-chain amino acid ABC transporter permease n=1 Tax=Clostridium tanneri TaxID=3037988 RepID=A0ABU4JV39_9CLOT|nr:branched-chain amino acid ABC transporter permease [Clostridium sp. A1-XYC3]MDW8802018.1 branched-chain amino acid ABC transporter permease [Clostridium sp. A1-XYC3]